VRSAAPALLLALGALCLFQSASAIVTLPALTPWGPTAKAPVTQWLLSNDATIIPFNDKLAWQKLGEAGSLLSIAPCLLPGGCRACVNHALSPLLRPPWLVHPAELPCHLTDSTHVSCFP
jgi:hypothetical protein